MRSLTLLSLVPAALVLGVIPLAGCRSTAVPRVAETGELTSRDGPRLLTLADDDEPGRTVELSAGLGLLGPGKVDVGGTTYVTDDEFYGKLSLDSFDSSNSLGVGVFYDIGKIDYHEPGGEATSGTVGVALKARYEAFDIGEDCAVLVTPGIGTGYRFDSKGGSGLALNLGVDLRARFETFDLFVEPGVLTQPTGSDNGRTQTFRPMPFVLFGAGVRF